MLTIPIARVSSLRVEPCFLSSIFFVCSGFGVGLQFLGGWSCSVTTEAKHFDYDFVVRSGDRNGDDGNDMWLYDIGGENKSLCFREMSWNLAERVPLGLPRTVCLISTWLMFGRGHEGLQHVFACIFAYNCIACLRFSWKGYCTYAGLSPCDYKWCYNQWHQKRVKGMLVLKSHHHLNRKICHGNATGVDSGSK